MPLLPTSDSPEDPQKLARWLAGILQGGLIRLESLRALITACLQCTVPGGPGGLSSLDWAQCEFQQWARGKDPLATLRRSQMTPIGENTTNKGLKGQMGP